MSTALLLTAAVVLPLRAEDPPQKNGAETKTEEKKPNEGDMMAMMMEMAKPGEPHKRMQEQVGSWSYVSKWWMSPDAPPSQSSGVAITRAVMDGRYFISEHSSKMQMPGPDGKMSEMEFKGMAVEGYDNAKKKYVASWIDNMGTGIMNLEGTYDAATRTLTYHAEYETMPGVKMKLREVITMTDRDHHTMEFFEDRGGKEVKTMQIDYVRKT
jgi:hypothetical protein